MPSRPRHPLARGVAGALVGVAALLGAVRSRAAETPSDEAVRAATQRGVRALAAAVQDEPYGLAFAHFLRRRFGLDAFADAPERYDALLAAASTSAPRPKGSKQPSASEMQLFRRLVRPDGVPDGDELATLLREREAMDQTTVPALYCDRRPLPPDYGALLGRQVAAGDYHSTHVGMALAWLRDNGCPLPVDQAVVDAWAADWAALVRTRQHHEVAYEAAGVLHYLGYGDRIPPDFTARVLAEQNADGGWSRYPSHDHSHWHATTLALWYLLEAGGPEPMDGFVPRAKAAGTP